MSNLNLSILGFPAVNGDLKVQVRDSGDTSSRPQRPFLDGTVRMTRTCSRARTSSPSSTRTWPCR